MRTKTMRTTVKAMAAGLAMLAMGAPALAQTWKAERAAGRVGEARPLPLRHPRAASAPI